jgi:hypothetical protein
MCTAAYIGSTAIHACFVRSSRPSMASRTFERLGSHARREHDNDMGRGRRRVYYSFVICSLFKASACPFPSVGGCEQPSTTRRDISHKFQTFGRILLRAKRALWVSRRGEVEVRELDARFSVQEDVWNWLAQYCASQHIYAYICYNEFAMLSKYPSENTTSNQPISERCPSCCRARAVTCMAKAIACITKSHELMKSCRIISAEPNKCHLRCSRPKNCSG